MTLFRSEVQQARSAQWLGVVRLGRPFSFSVFVFTALGLAALLIAFAAWGEVNRKSKISGLLVPEGGSLNITAPAAGIVTQRPVEEGQTVTAGTLLLVLNTERQSLQTHATTTTATANNTHNNANTPDTINNTSLLVAQQINLRKQSLQTERTLRELQTRQREQTLSDRINTLAAQINQADTEIQLQQSRLSLASKTVERYTHLAQEGFLPDIQLQTKQEEHLDAQSRLQTLQRSRLALQQDHQALNGERKALRGQHQNDTAQIERNQSSLEQELTENATRTRMAITAPSEMSGGGKP